jgi:hypothetical protein
MHVVVNIENMTCWVPLRFQNWSHSYTTEARTARIGGLDLPSLLGWSFSVVEMKRACNRGISAAVRSYQANLTAGEACVKLLARCMSQPSWLLGHESWLLALGSWQH